MSDRIRSFSSPCGQAGVSSLHVCRPPEEGNQQESRFVSDSAWTFLLGRKQKLPRSWLCNCQHRPGFAANCLSSLIVAFPQLLSLPSSTCLERKELCNRRDLGRRERACLTHKTIRELLKRDSPQVNSLQFFFFLVTVQFLLGCTNFKALWKLF